jgi:nucleoside 2-deoxyribosyltransferase
MIVYLIGSLRDPNVRTVAKVLRDRHVEVFDDWHAAGEKGDEEWMKYEKERGRTYWQALEGHAAKHTFEYDLHHLQQADVGVLVAPAGRSAHLELGYMLGQGKPGIIYMPEEPERWDVMVKFATQVCQHINGLVAHIEDLKRPVGV